MRSSGCSVVWGKWGCRCKQKPCQEGLCSSTRKSGLGCEGTGRCRRTERRGPCPAPCSCTHLEKLGFFRKFGWRLFGNPDLMEDEDVNIHMVLMGDILEIELVGLFTK